MGKKHNKHTGFVEQGSSVLVAREDSNFIHACSLASLSLSHRVLVKNPDGTTSLEKITGIKRKVITPEMMVENYKLCPVLYIGGFGENIIVGRGQKIRPTHGESSKSFTKASVLAKKKMDAYFCACADMTSITYTKIFTAKKDAVIVVNDLDVLASYEDAQ